jgi:hypothetical protein
MILAAEDAFIPNAPRAVSFSLAAAPIPKTNAGHLVPARLQRKHRAHRTVTRRNRMHGSATVSADSGIVTLTILDRVGQPGFHPI